MFSIFRRSLLATKAQEEWEDFLDGYHEDRSYEGLLSGMRYLWKRCHPEHLRRSHLEALRKPQGSRDIDDYIRSFQHHRRCCNPSEVPKKTAMNIFIQGVESRYKTQLIGSNVSTVADCITVVHNVQKFFPVDYSEEKSSDEDSDGDVGKDSSKSKNGKKASKGSLKYLREKLPEDVALYLDRYMQGKTQQRQDRVYNGVLDKVSTLSMDSRALIHQWAEETSKTLDQKVDQKLNLILDRFDPLVPTYDEVLTEDGTLTYVQNGEARQSRAGRRAAPWKFQKRPVNPAPVSAASHEEKVFRGPPAQPTNPVQVPPLESRQRPPTRFSARRNSFTRSPPPGSSEVPPFLLKNGKLFRPGVDCFACG